LNRALHLDVPIIQHHAVNPFFLATIPACRSLSNSSGDSGQKIVSKGLYSALINVIFILFFGCKVF
jgi:hypothetical protein